MVLDAIRCEVHISLRCALLGNEKPKFGLRHPLPPLQISGIPTGRKQPPRLYPQHSGLLLSTGLDDLRYILSRKHSWLLLNNRIVPGEFGLLEIQMEDNG